MHAICEKELSLGKWKKVDDAQCLQKCPYAESENQVLEEKSLLELKALRIERMTPNSFECHEKSENIENQEDQIFLDVNVVSLHLVAERPSARKAVNTNLKPPNGQNA